MFPIPFNPFGAFVLAQFQAINFRLRSTPLRRKLQKASAKNQNVIVGNIGAVATGVQDANPLNVA